MTEVQQNFSVYQGQDRLITIPVVDNNEDPKPMTGGSAGFYVLDDPSDDLSEALFSITGSDIGFVDYDDTDDAVQFTIKDTHTENLDIGRYYHEVWVSDPAGNDNPVCTGWMTLKPSPWGRD